MNTSPASYSLQICESGRPVPQFISHPVSASLRLCASAFRLVLLILLTLCAFPSRAAEKLNVVFILADDLGWAEVGAYGQKKIPTPNIDRLAREGIRFTQHYSGAPVCAPARCVLMTGKHLGRAEIRGNIQAQKHFPEFTEGQYPLSEKAVTLAQLFQNSGYRTGAFGKWGLGPVGSTGDPNKKGFDTFFGYNCQAVAHSYYPPHLWRNSEKIIINQSPIPGHKPQPAGEVRLNDWLAQNYAPKLMIEEAVKFIEENAARPFFLYLPFVEPHVAMHPPKESVERFPKEWDEHPYRGEAGYLPHPRPRAGYAAMISDLDSHVGRILDSLRQHNLDRNTLVIFTSDNGTTHRRREEHRFHVGGVDPEFFNSTAHLRGYKGSVYEGGIRVPMIAKLPGRIPAGAVNESPTYFADWLPTLCEATSLNPPGRTAENERRFSDPLSPSRGEGQGEGRPGAEVRTAEAASSDSSDQSLDTLDGESFWTALTANKPFTRKSPMVWVFPEYGGQVAIRIGSHKAIRQSLNTKTPGPWEIYDLATDPSEKQNLAPTRADIIAEAETILRAQAPENPIFPVNTTAPLP